MDADLIVARASAADRRRLLRLVKGLQSQRLNEGRAATDPELAGGEIEPQ